MYAFCGFSFCWASVERKPTFFAEKFGVQARIFVGDYGKSSARRSLDFKVHFGEMQQGLSLGAGHATLVEKTFTGHIRYLNCLSFGTT